MTVKVGTLSADLDLDGNPFERNLDRMMSTGAAKAQQIGDKMTTRVTLPLVAAGGAAVKMGMDFETSMSRMVGLVGLSTDEVGELKTGIMELSGETAKSPQELADAMFTVTSAGFRGAEAMDVLTSAAKASAAGLGETRTIAEALTGAVNAYGPEVLDAARATDILVATARAGNFESSQLAGVLGKITPFAKQAGASLEDVGGAIALLTRVNNNATESGTQVAAMMRAFVAPGAEAVNTFEDLYGSTQAFRDIIARDGVVAALQDLDGKLGGSREALAKLLGSSEAASAAFQILDADAATLEGTFGTVTDSVGMTEEAFLAWAGTSGATLGKALADLQVALIEAGSTIAPFVAAVAGGLSTVAEAFSALPGPVQNVLLGFTGLLAVTGPLLSVGGRLAQNWARISGAFDKVATGAYGAAGGIGKFGTAVGALALTAVVFELSSMAKELTTVNTEVERLNGLADDELADTLERMLTRAFTGHAGNPSEAAADFADEIERIARESPAAAESLLRIAQGAGGDLATAMERAGVTTDIMSEAMERGVGAAARSGEAQERNADIIGEATGATEEHTEATEENADAAEEAAAAQEELEDAIKAVTNAIRSQLDPLFAAQDALDGHREAQDKVKAAQLEALVAQQNLDAAIREHGRQSDEAALASLELAAAQEKVKDADRDVVRSALDVVAATAELKMRVDDGSVSIREAEAQLRRWVEQGIITAGQAHATAQELRGTTAAAEELGRQNPHVPVTSDTSQARAALDHLDARVAQITRDRTMRIYVNPVIPSDGSFTGDWKDYARPEGRWTGGPTLPGKDYIVGEHGPELLRMSGGAGVVESAPATRSGMAGSSTAGGSNRVEHHRHVTVQYPPDKPSTKAISHELHLIELGNP